MKQKQCSSCQELLDLEMFGLNKARKDGRQSQCKACRALYVAGWYVKNKEKHLERVKNSKHKRRLYNMTRILEYFESHPCSDCGQTDFRVLQFDHRDQLTKSFTIGKEVPFKSWESIKSEIDKCDIRCANCHMIRTSRQLGWYAYLDMPDSL